jgi:serine/threonine protein kinase
MDSSHLDDYAHDLRTGAIMNTTEFQLMCTSASVLEVQNAINLRDINDVDSDWNNSLFYAAAGQNAPVLEYLLDFNMTDPMYTNAFGTSLVEFIQRFLPGLPDRKSFYATNAPAYVQPRYSYDVYRIIAEDDITAFEERFADYTDDVLMIACQANSPNIASFCIQKRFGLNHVSEEKTTAFTYACYNQIMNVIDLLIVHMDKGVLLLRDRRIGRAELYLTGNNGVHLKLKEKREEDVKSEFRFFLDSEFTAIPMKKVNSGSYGAAKKFSHNPSGMIMTVKEYKDCHRELITDDTMAEIVLNRYLNSVNPNVAVKIYGLVVKNDCANLVLETLEYTLEEYFDVTKPMLRPERFAEYKRVLFNLFTNVNILCEAGILHNDLSPRNIMLDSNKRLRFIDFGLAEYWGLSPAKTYARSERMIPTLKGPEVDCEGYTNPFYVQGARKNMTSDVFSIATVFMSLVYDGALGWNSYVHHGGLFYKMRIRPDYPPQYESFDVGFLNNQDPLLVDLLSRALNSNPNVRWTAKELLEHEYFTGRAYEPKRSPIELSRMVSSYRETYNGINNELLYRNEILNIAQFRRLLVPTNYWANPVYDDHFIHGQVSNALGYAKRSGTSFDTVVNYVPRFLAAIAALPTEVISYVSYSTLVMTSYVFDCRAQFGMSYVLSFESMARMSTSIEKELIRVSQDIILNTDVCLDFCPVVTLITYLVTELQIRERLDGGDATELDYSIRRCVFNWVMWPHDLNPTMWELVVAAYYSGRTHGDHWERNDELIAEVVRTNSLAYTNLSSATIDGYIRMGF